MAYSGFGEYVYLNLVAVLRLIAPTTHDKLITNEAAIDDRMGMD